MGELIIKSPDGDLTFQIVGNEPTVSESIKIKNILQDRKKQTSRVQRIRERQEQNPLFDTKSGIQNAALRAALSTAETAEEEEAQLQKLYGLGEGDYARDNRGR